MSSNYNHFLFVYAGSGAKLAQSRQAPVNAGLVYSILEIIHQWDEVFATRT